MQKSLAVQWLGLHALTAKDLAILGPGTKISQATRGSPKIKYITRWGCWDTDRLVQGHSANLGWAICSWLLCFCCCSVTKSCLTLWDPMDRSTPGSPEVWLLVAQIVNNLPAMQETWVQSLGWEDAPEKGILPTLVFLPQEFHGQRSLEGYSPWGCKESDMTEWLRFSASVISLKSKKILWKSKQWKM